LASQAPYFLDHNNKGPQHIEGGFGFLKVAIACHFLQQLIPQYRLGYADDMLNFAEQISVKAKEQ